MALGQMVAQGIPSLSAFLKQDCGEFRIGALILITLGALYSVVIRREAYCCPSFFFLEMAIYERASRLIISLFRISVRPQDLSFSYSQCVFGVYGSARKGPAVFTA